MLPATLVTLATFLLDLSSASPVYNMQPAFITTNIGSTSGRNIRNLPCISRKNSGLSGVCMFAIDCLKANGTHLGTCIDRFYFGSCCHIEPIKDHSVETNIILDTREPPERVQNTTHKVSTSTLASTSTSQVLIINRLNQTSTMLSTSTSTSVPSIAISFGDRLTTIETTTSPPKLQTFQVVNSETTTSMPLRTSTKPSSTITKPQPAITAPSKPEKPVLSSSTTKPSTTSNKSSATKPSTIKPSTTKPSTRKPSTTKPSAIKPSTGKPSLKPTKPSQKPIKVVTTTKKPLVTTTTSKKTVATTKPTRRGTRPTSSTAKTTTTKSPVRTTTKPTITKKPASTKKPTLSTTKITTTSPTTKATTTFTTTTMVYPSSSTITVADEPVIKKNISQIWQSETANPAVNEVVVESSSVSLGSTIESATSQMMPDVPVQTESPLQASTIFSTSSTSTKAPPSSTIVTSPSIDVPTDVPIVPPSFVTWTVEDTKNHTVENNETVAVNITEEWVPITTPDGWVLLPIVTSSTSTPLTSNPSQNDTSTSSSSILDPLSTSTIFYVTTTIAPETSTLASEVTSIINMTSTTESATIIENFTLSNEPSTSTEEITPKPVNMSDYTDVCGRRMWPEARIVGGEKSAFGRWPWQISLRQWRTSTYLHKCGAALLNENWAITAAHCVENVPPSNLLLRLGEHDLSTEGEPYLHEERRVQIVASHPQFDSRTFEYDLALLRFYEPVQFQPNIIPVCVPKTDENFVGRTAYVTGWGRLYEDGPLPSILQEVSVPVINNSVCESMYRNAGYIEHIPHIFICAGWRKGGFDSCEGDSGGPMVIQREDKRFMLAGVISWGIGCAEPNQPGVYTRISEFREWINQILQF
ncbi:serine proteinase stubble [Anthonomus grandis grandis]|uniref:serine proteinase stubble n=1 Tax=Anthonomus grandis grandis TaxID=2921223 RepID=UPI002165FB36|nr:serine proteinase stubble [Anthonomus grandis grandis]